MTEYADIDVRSYKREGISGAFIMSLDDGSTYEVEFTYDGRSGRLALHGIDHAELHEFRACFQADAREAYMTSRDSGEPVVRVPFVTDAVPTFMKNLSVKDMRQVTN